MSQGKRGRGRPKGSKNQLPYGSKQLIELANEADRLGIKTQEAWGLIRSVLLGRHKQERHIGERLRAAFFVLEQEIGKAKQKVEVTTVPADGEFRAVFDDGAAIPTSATEDLPN